MQKIIILILLFRSINIIGQNLNYSADTIQFKSLILNENRSIIVFKPRDVSTTDSVGFIYLIDGEFANFRYEKIKERSGDSKSKIIAVGIVNTQRNRDLLFVKGADKFLDFITTELISVVEKDYKAKSRVLYGHSFGGGFTIYAMINKPNYFNCYIASSPTPIMDLVPKENYLKIDSLATGKISFYLSYGSKDMVQVCKWSQKLKNNLTGLSFSNLNWQFDVFEGKNHSNSDIPALINGLKEFE